jgi:hypothetical protein
MANPDAEGGTEARRERLVTPIGRRYGQKGLPMSYIRDCRRRLQKQQRPTDLEAAWRGRCLGADYSAGGSYQGICVLRARYRCERRIAFHRRCTVLRSLFWMLRGDARTSRRWQWRISNNEIANQNGLKHFVAFQWIPLRIRQF